MGDILKEHGYRFADLAEKKGYPMTMSKCIEGGRTQ